MGMAKRDHIRLVGPRRRRPGLARAHGRDFDDAAIDAIFEVFEPLNVAAVEAHERA